MYRPPPLYSLLTQISSFLSLTPLVYVPISFTVFALLTWQMCPYSKFDRANKGNSYGICNWLPKLPGGVDALGRHSSQWRYAWWIEERGGGGGAKCFTKSREKMRERERENFRKFEYDSDPSLLHTDRPSVSHAEITSICSSQIRKIALLMTRGWVHIYVEISICMYIYK